MWYHKNGIARRRITGDHAGMMTIRDRFAIALRYEVERRDRGFQARMADALCIPRNRLNDYLKNRINCPEDLRERCAAYLGMEYDEMLKKGLALAGENPPQPAAAPPPTPQPRPPIPADVLEAVRDRRIQRVVRLLAREFKG